MLNRNGNILVYGGEVGIKTFKSIKLVFYKINYFDVQPPSIINEEPVIIDEALDAR